MSDRVAEDGRTEARKSWPWYMWVLSTVGALALFLMILLILSIATSRGDYRPAKVTARDGGEAFKLYGPYNLGANLVYFEIARHRNSGSSSSRLDNRNVLLLDRSSGLSRRLLPDNQRAIVDPRFLSAKSDILDRNAERIPPPRDETKAPAEYYVVPVVRDEGSKTQDVLIGTLATGRQAFVLRGIDAVDQVWMHNPTQIGFIVRENLQLYYRIVDVPSLKVVVSKKIEID